MNIDSLDKYIIIYEIHGFLNFFDLYNLSIVSKYFCKLYRDNYVVTKEYVYDYFIKTFKSNIEFSKFALNDCIFSKKMEKVYYINEIEDGIYYYSKRIFTDDYADPFYTNYPIRLNVYSHTIYLLIFIFKGEHRTYIIKKFEDHLQEYKVDCEILKQYEMVTKIY